MMALANKVGRQKAHDLIYDICHQANANDKSLLELLSDNAEVSQNLTVDQLKQLLEPERYTGLASVMVDKLLKQIT